MKPFAKTNDDYGNTGCCPVHDKPYIKKWTGMYGSRHSLKTYRKLTKEQNRKARRLVKEEIKREYSLR